MMQSKQVTGRRSFDSLGQMGNQFDTQRDLHRTA
jgi:hypothetical protein